jgi:hypothetical protein
VVEAFSAKRCGSPSDENSTQLASTASGSVKLEPASWLPEAPESSGAAVPFASAGSEPKRTPCSSEMLWTVSPASITQFEVSSGPSLTITMSELMPVSPASMSKATMCWLPVRIASARARLKASATARADVAAR